MAATYPTFTPSVISLKVGESVRFVVTSTDVPHTFSIDELGVDLALNPGATVTSDIITPSVAAQYTFYCRPHRVFGGMAGQLQITQ